MAKEKKASKKSVESDEEIEDLEQESDEEPEEIEEDGEQLRVPQSTILKDRYMEMLLADRAWLLPRLLIGPALAGLLGWLAVAQGWQAPQPRLIALVFLCFLWAALCSCTEVVRERAFVMRERMAKLRLGSFLWSRMRTLALLNTAQAILATAALEVSAQSFGIPLGWMFFNLFFAYWLGSGVGLFVSTRAKIRRHAFYLLPFFTFPTLLMTPLFIKGDEINIFLFLSPLYWGMRSLEHFGDGSVPLKIASAEMMGVALFAVLAFGACYYSMMTVKYIDT